MISKPFLWVAFGLAAAGCATMPSDAERQAQAAAMLKASFKENGQAKLDRLDQDETQRACSALAGKPPSKELAETLEKANLATIQWPADGKLVGDWKNGERIAQEGRGKQFTDDPAGPVGGNCYACHQISKQEISYGTIGPSLQQFGKLRGYNDEIRKYAYGKVYNPDAYAACSLMPRFGQHQILSEQQVKDVVGLLMDPQSPVNQ